MNRSGKVFHQTNFAGMLSEDEDGYHFQYDEKYLNQANAQAISLTIPLRNNPFHSPVLFPFFDGLIPEGWLMDIAIQNWKLNPRDRMGLLLSVCKDCIGAVSIINKNTESI